MCHECRNINSTSCLFNAFFHDKEQFYTHQAPLLFRKSLNQTHSLGMHFNYGCRFFQYTNTLNRETHYQNILCC